MLQRLDCPFSTASANISLIALSAIFSTSISLFTVSARSSDSNGFPTCCNMCASSSRTIAIACWYFVSQSIFSFVSLLLLLKRVDFIKILLNGWAILGNILVDIRDTASPYCSFCFQNSNLVFGKLDPADLCCRLRKTLREFQPSPPTPGTDADTSCF